MTIREERKHLSRLAFLEAALNLTQEKRGFNSISLRELAQQVNLVPSAFYRHFKDLNQLGLELVDYVALNLKPILIHAAQHIENPEYVQKILEHAFQQKPDIWHFILAERWSGSLELRLSLEQEINFLIEDVYAILERHPTFKQDCQDQYQQFAHLFVHLSFTWAMQWFNASCQQNMFIKPSICTQIEMFSSCILNNDFAALKVKH